MKQKKGQSVLNKKHILINIILAIIVACFPSTSIVSCYLPDMLKYFRIGYVLHCGHFGYAIRSDPYNRWVGNKHGFDFMNMKAIRANKAILE